MLTFALAVFLLLITPGPGVLSTAGVGAAYGMNAGFRYLIGLFIGTNLVAIAVVSGLSALLLANPVVRTVLLVLSAAYLLYLAFRIAFAGAKISFIEAKKQPGLISGVLLQIINPKAYAVNTTLFTGFAFMPGSMMGETIIKFVVINAIWIPIHILWLWAGSSLRKLDLAPHIQFRINILMALAMLGVVVLAALYSAR
ncbi:MAG: lysine transporter LysE [Hyphomicrobiales bacterium]|nr:LysE family translocator [Hyphomicrobiales bacterium]PCJ85180.1 MAG: lysine transporter LysE [Hyphomicrobiales bacterium]